MAKNYPILRKTISSYFVRIKKAVLREDFLSINHRTAAFLASYFDILFAINCAPHPGEKRLIERIEQYCKMIHKNLEQDLPDLTWSISENSPIRVLDPINKLIDNLEDLLKKEKFI